MSLEYISPEGLRLDGRRPGEIRNVECKLGVMSSRATGSAYLEMGNTKVLCSVFGPKESSQRSKALFDRAVITCECSTAPFATGERRKRFKGDKCVFLLKSARPRRTHACPCWMQGRFVAVPLP